MPRLKIVEVGPRDGLQNETAAVPTHAKVAFVDALSHTGVREIEVSAFVSSRMVPQLNDAEAVLRGIHRQDGVCYTALVPNEQGLERAMAAGVDKVSVFTAVSETFNRKNINTSRKGSLQRFQPIIRRARRMGIPVRGYVSTAFWCAFEGRIPPAATVDLAERLVDLGADEVAISDTVGKARPHEVAGLLDRLLPRIPIEGLAVHFHDTYGRGVVNALQAWDYGIRIIDASVGGLGGCPFAPGATGNVATEAIVEALAAKGASVGVDSAKLRLARDILDPFIGVDRRTRPQAGGPVCTACEHFTDAACCGWEAVAG